MRYARQLLSAGSAIVAAGLACAPGSASAERPVVVELFTSQGCSSCPPANVNLGRLSRRPDVLALSFGVTYWDYLGWKDSFARPEFTDRQVSYEAGLGHSGPFTPQMVVNGRADAVGNRIGEVESLVADAGRAEGPDVDLSGGQVTVGAGAKPADGADIWAVSFDPRTVEVPVARGENSGRTLPHSNVVHGLMRIGIWAGVPVTVALPDMPAGLSVAVLVQESHGGPIIAAARRDASPH